MKILIQCFVLILFVACASEQRKKAGIEQEINDFESKSLHEIEAHLELVINAHPELSQVTKKKIVDAIGDTLEKQQALKDEESKVVQMLLSKSLVLNEEKSELAALNKDLKQRLLEIYNLKSENIFLLISRITEMSYRKEIDENFTRDIQIFMRDFR